MNVISYLFKPFINFLLGWVTCFKYVELVSLRKVQFKFQSLLTYALPLFVINYRQRVNLMLPLRTSLLMVQTVQLRMRMSQKLAEAMVATSGGAL